MLIEILSSESESESEEEESNESSEEASTESMEESDDGHSLGDCVMCLSAPREVVFKRTNLNL